MEGRVKRIAIIGLGAVARNIHLPAYGQLGDRLAIVGGCDPDAAARDSAQQRGLPLVVAEPRELLERTKPDLVAVCTPPLLHREHAELALSAGCHVFLEKPLAPDLTEADAIIAAADRAARQVVVNNQFPYMRSHLAAKERIGTDEFGRLLYLHAWHTMRPTDLTEAGWRGALRRRLGFEFGIHVFDLVRFFFGDSPRQIMAHLPHPDPSLGWDAVNVVAMEFADGRGASMVLDRLSKGRERYLDLRLDGERAAIHTSIGGQLSLSAGLHTRERRPFFDLRVVPGARAVLEQGTRSRVLATDGTNPFAAATARHLANFLDAIEQGATPPGNVRDNRGSLALVLAAYESAESGRTVDLSLHTPGSGPVS
jgi:predicted dehydrogenase